MACAEFHPGSRLAASRTTGEFFLEIRNRHQRPCLTARQRRSSLPATSRFHRQKHLNFQLPFLLTTMNLRLSTGIAALSCVVLASCYPYNENPHKKKPAKTPEKIATTPDPQKLKEQEALKNKEQEKLAEEKIAENPDTTTTTTPSTEKTPPSVETKREYTVANKVPGKDGFVFSPYNNKVVDVRDIPSGTLVQDPTYPAAEKKYFRVP
jgi:hypothetical protein